MPGTGLLLWRIDTDLEQVSSDWPAMLLNQADGWHNLESPTAKNGSDTSDPFPGSSDKLELLDTGNISKSLPDKVSGVQLRNIHLDPATGNIALDVHVEY